MYCDSFVIKYSRFRASGSVVERVPDKNEVQGSIPCSPTYMKEKFPAEGPIHFQTYLENIKIYAEEFPNEPPLWTSIKTYGYELEQSLKQGKVTKEEAEAFRRSMASFMSQGSRRDNYRSYLGKAASFWWEKGGGEA